DLMKAFVARIGQDAVQKDRILRGNGYEFPDTDRSRLRALMLVDDVGPRANALRTHQDRLHGVADMESQQQAASSETVLILKPTIWGMGVDLRAFWNNLRKSKKT